jgi:uncharacterized protein (DUF3084 family)
MTSAYILIAATLLLGGLIAALGDRLGTKVGKARLRLFNLRPRETAVVVTVLTGTIIAASTLGILFTLSESLRQGVFDLDNILKKRREVQKELERVTRDKKKVEQELTAAKTEQTVAQKNLASTHRNFQQARTQLKIVSRQANTLRSEIKTLVNERQPLLQQRIQLKQNITQLQTQLRDRDRELTKQEQKIADRDQSLKERQIRLQNLEKQQSVLQTEIDRRDERILNLDTEIAQKNGNLRVRETQLKNLESQITYLQKQVEVLEEYYQTYQELREKRIAIVRGQVLAFAAVRIMEPKTALEAVDRLLTQANRTAIAATRPGNGQTNERVAKITKAQVEQLIAQIQDGRDYVVRILSAGNYVQGEQEIRVFADVAPNQEIFDKGEVIAAISLDSVNRTPEDLQKRLDLLLAASQFRARRAGILGAIQVEEGNIKTILDFIDKLNASEASFDEVKAVVADTTYTAGPLKLHLIAVKNGKIILSTLDFS